MKRIHPEDPRVTAHALGELPEREAAEVERAALVNPAVQAAMDEARSLAELIRAGYRTESHELGEARREAIRRAGRRPAPENLVSLDRSRKWRRPAAVTAAAAALVACAVWMMQKIPVGDDGLTAERERVQREELRKQILLAAAPRPDRVGPGRAPSPAAPRSSLYELEPGIPSEVMDEEYLALRKLLKADPDAFVNRVKEVARTAALPSLANLPPLTDNPFVPSKEEARSTVPIVSGNASYTLVERFVRTEKKLPPKNGVRIEELINHVTYEDAGEADLNGINLGAELVHCPWDPGAILMGVLLRNGSEVPITRAAILQVEVKPDHIRSYRLLGYAGAAGPDAHVNSVPQGLDPDKSNFVLYQLQPLDHEVFQKHRVVARVGLRLDHEHPRGLIVPVTSPPRDWVNASNNLQTAVVLGAWGMMLRESPYRGKLNPRLLEQLARDARNGAGEEDLGRREALQLVLDSLPYIPDEDNL